jgi:hypothetical protein
MKMTFKSKNEIVKYRLLVMNIDKKWVPWRVGCNLDLDWFQVTRCIERLRIWKRGWVGKRDFPIMKFKLVELKAAFDCTENQVLTTVEESTL